MEEIWKDVEGYEGLYQVSNYGRIKSLERKCINGYPIKERIMKPTKNTKNYLGVNLFKNGKSKAMMISKLVSQAFPEICGSLFEGCHIHHKDHNPQNNCADNLIVVSAKEHQKIHKEELPQHERIRIIYKYDNNWNFIDVYENARLAAASVNGNVHSLNYAMRSESKYYKGFRWLVA